MTPNSVFGKGRSPKCSSIFTTPPYLQPYWTNLIPVRPAVVSPLPRTCERVSKKLKTQPEPEYDHFKDEQSPKNPLLHVASYWFWVISSGLSVLGHQFWLMKQSNVQGILLGEAFKMRVFRFWATFRFCRSKTNMSWRVVKLQQVSLELNGLK